VRKLNKLPFALTYFRFFLSFTFTFEALEKADSYDETDESDALDEDAVSDSVLSSTTAKCNCEVSSEIDPRGGKGRGSEGAWGLPLLGKFSCLGVASTSRWSEGGESKPESVMRSCIKWGIVDIRGESAQGFVEDVRS
jgi:hypothetical protein